MDHIDNPGTSSHQGSASDADLLRRIVKTFGIDFLRYVLACEESDFDHWIEDSTGLQPGSRVESIQFLIELSNHINASAEDPIIAEMQTASYLGTYSELTGLTLVSSLRNQITGDQMQENSVGSLEGALTQLAREFYPLFLIPVSDKRIPLSSAAMYSHPLHAAFERHLKQDEVFSKLFTHRDEDEGMGPHIFRSTGRSSGIQIELFGSTLINSGWRFAKLRQAAIPNIDQYLEATLDQLHLIRDALEGKGVRVPAVFAFTGVSLPSASEISVPNGKMRCADERDEGVSPSSLEGKISTQNNDGETVTLNYSGDVVYETTIRYKLLRGHYDDEWPTGFNGLKDIPRRIENIQLGLTISKGFNPDNPILAIPTWNYIHDPLAHGYEVSWNDPRRGKPFVPFSLSEEDLVPWQHSADLIGERRGTSIDVAIRRTIRAVAERQDYSDALVDAVIAWENLVGARGDTTLRVTGALAWLLATDADNRSDLQSEISKIYALRSDLVHGSKEEHSPAELVDKSGRAIEIAVLALSELFENRSDLLKIKDSADRSQRLLMGM
jgi:hypothetical protein